MDKDVYNDTFIMVLSSNESLKFYPNNEPSNFTVQFDKNIELQRNMEVALIETIFSDGNEHLKTEDKKIISIAKLNINRENVHIMEININLSLSKIYDILSLVEELNETLSTITLKDVKDRIERSYVDNGVYIMIEYITMLLPTLNYNFTDNKLELKKGEIKAVLTEHEGHTDELEWDLSWIFDNKLVSLIEYLIHHPNSVRYESRAKPDINIIRNYYIYIDIIKPSIIGSLKSNLLRIVSRSNINYKNSVEFKNKIFIPVSKQLIESITVTIKDDKGKLINFHGDKIILILLFRPLEHI